MNEELYGGIENITKILLEELEEGTFSDCDEQFQYYCYKYITNLQQETETNKTIIEKQVKRIYELEWEKEKLKKWLEERKYILAKSVSHIYEDSLGHSKFVNEEIFEELTRVLDKIKELEEGVKWVK